MMRAAAFAALLGLIATTTGSSFAPPAVQMEMKNVRLHMDDGIVLDVSRLRGTMVSRDERTPPVFDDPASYVLHLQTADISMDMSSLQNLMNRHVFAYQGAPLRNVTIEPDGPRLKMKGKLHKGVDIPFSTTASVSATADGLLRMHVESMNAIGLPTKGLLDLFGLKLDDVLDLKKRRGLEMQDNDIVLAAGQILPAPEMVGRLTRVAVQGSRLVETFSDPDQGRPAALRLPSPAARNYVYFGGGTLTFGKLTMRDADLQIIDADPSDPFDFFPARYHAQLVAGYSKNTPAGGLKTYLPDFADLHRAARKR